MKTVFFFVGASLGQAVATENSQVPDVATAACEQHDFVQDLRLTPKYSPDLGFSLMAGVTGSIRGAQRRQADRREAHPVGHANLFDRLRGIGAIAKGRCDHTELHFCVSNQLSNCGSHLCINKIQAFVNAAQKGIALSFGCLVGE